MTPLTDQLRDRKHQPCDDCTTRMPHLFPRAADTICLHCGALLCGFHARNHLHAEHFVDTASPPNRPATPADEATQPGRPTP